jgi:exonuclease VII small subunit
MWKKENDVEDPQRMTETLTAYEEAVKDFAASTAELLEYIPLLTKARDAYQRAMAASTRLHAMLDTGDETVRTLMARMEHALDVQSGKDASDKKPEAVQVETIKPSGEKAVVARA